MGVQGRKNGAPCWFRTSDPHRVKVVLVQGATEVAAPTRPLLFALAMVAAACVLVSWAQYLWLFLRLMRLPSQRERA